MNFLTCLLLNYYIKSLIYEDAFSPFTCNSWWWSSFEILAIIRAFRWTWQNTESSLVELSVFHILITYIQPIFTNNHYGPSDFVIYELSRPVQLLILGFVRDRAKQTVEKIYLVTSLAVSSLEDKASKRSYAGCLFQLNLIFAPVVLVIILVSSVISAPMLATFTLPVYFLAYPRPLRFWPDGPASEATASGDAVYYEQMVPVLLESVHKALRAGRLGLQQPGNHLLARHEDRTVWIQILEKGNGYVW